MPRQIEKGDPGTDRNMLIDGMELSVYPADLDAPPEPLSDYLDHLSGRITEWQRRSWFDGVANYNDRYTFTFELAQIPRADRIIMEEMRVTGGMHRLTIWRMVPIIWTCRTDVSRYYIPALRKPAAHLYDGLMIGGSAGAVEVNTENFPIDATLNGDALTVTYADGPTLADPGDGGIVIARVPDASGETADYTAVRLGGDLVTGDILTVWGVWTHEVSLRSPGVTMRGQVENQAFVFVEG